MANTVDNAHIAMHGNWIPAIPAGMTDELSSHVSFYPPCLGHGWLGKPFIPKTFRR